MKRHTLQSFRGFSLVELMVAMALSLVLLAGVLGVLYSSKVTYSENERLARLQESARAAVEMILRDMRSGGFQGCGKPLEPADFWNMLLDGTSITAQLRPAAFGLRGQRRNVLAHAGHLDRERLGNQRRRGDSRRSPWRPVVPHRRRDG